MAMVLQFTSPCNHQNRLVVVVVSVWVTDFLPPTVESIWLAAFVNTHRIPPSTAEPSTAVGGAQCTYLLGMDTRLPTTVRTI
jgi:hypothetical protein